MKTALVTRLVIATAILGLVGCDEPGPVDTDHIWTVSYSVANTSSQSIVVELSGPVMQAAGSGREAQNPGAGGATQRDHGIWPEFLGPPPDAGRDWWCIEVWRAQMSTLVGQLCPVTNEQWTRSDSGRYTTEFTLVISDDDMEPTTNHCPRLEGI